MDKKRDVTKFVASILLSMLALVSIFGQTVVAQTKINANNITGLAVDGETLVVNVTISQTVTESDLQLFLNNPYLCTLVGFYNYTSYRIEWVVTAEDAEAVNAILPANFSSDCSATTTTRSPTTTASTPPSATTGLSTILTSTDEVSDTGTTNESFSGPTLTPLITDGSTTSISVDTTQTTPGVTATSSTSVESTQTSTGDGLSSPASDQATQTSTGSTLTSSTSGESTQTTAATEVPSVAGSTQEPDATVSSGANQGLSGGAFAGTVLGVLLALVVAVSLILLLKFRRIH